MVRQKGRKSTESVHNLVLSLHQVAPSDRDILQLPSMHAHVVLPSMHTQHALVLLLLLLPQVLWRLGC
jgi:hypothetical protein